MTSFWFGPTLPTSFCGICGSQYVGMHFCSTRQPANQPDWRLPDADVERIAQRVVELMRQKRMAEQ